MQAPDGIRRRYCANCGREIAPGHAIEINNRVSVCSEECRKEFSRGKIV
jgi:transcriptional regulator NrdR family protein